MFVPSMSCLLHFSHQSPSPWVLWFLQDPLTHRAHGGSCGGSQHQQGMEEPWHRQWKCSSPCWKLRKAEPWAEVQKSQCLGLCVLPTSQLLCLCTWEKEGTEGKEEPQREGRSRNCPEHSSLDHHSSSETCSTLELSSSTWRGAVAALSCWQG